MAKIKTGELIGPALDWVVAYAEGRKFSTVQSSIGLKPFVVLYDDPLGMFTPSTSWAQGGSIIQREGIGIRQYGDFLESRWQADKWAFKFADPMATGPTPLIAAMRCLITSKLGEVVEVPDELL